MYRGEPLALHTIIIGLFFFILTLILGIIATSMSYVGLITSHFISAFLGWICFIMFGAQLQLYRTLAGIRKYSPKILRYAYLGLLICGYLIFLLGILFKMNFLMVIAGFLYLTASLIHLYWLLQGKRSKIFKFPLDYIFVSHLFFIIGLFYLIIGLIQTGTIFIRYKTIIVHIWGVGWISLTLQGVIIRIFPMFLGLNIHQKSKSQISLHFILTSISSSILIIGFIVQSENQLLLYFHWLGGLFWSFTWIWSIVILGKSVILHKREIKHKITMYFFIPGIFWFLIGLLFGFGIAFADASSYILIRRLHIHFTLLLGISLIMLGAIHRISSFQIYTILYIGKQKTKGLSDFLREKKMMPIALGTNLFPFIIIFGFIIDNLIIVGLGGILYLICILFFVILIMENYRIYFKEKSTALPFYLKQSEVN